MENIDDINDIIGWLNFRGKSSISPGIGLIVDALWENLDHLDERTTLDTIAIIIDLAQRSTKPGELAEVSVECGMVASNKGLHQKALELLQQALSKYIAQLHEYAVVKWLIGCVLMEIPSERLRALESFNSSIEMLDRLSKGRLSDARDVDWYRARSKELEQVLLGYIQYQIQTTLPALTGSQAWAVDPGMIGSAEDRDRFRRFLRHVDLPRKKDKVRRRQTFPSSSKDSTIEQAGVDEKQPAGLDALAQLAVLVTKGDVILAQVASAEDALILQPLAINGKKIIIFPKGPT